MFEIDDEGQYHYLCRTCGNDIDTFKDGYRRIWKVGRADYCSACLKARHPYNVAKKTGYCMLCGLPVYKEGAVWCEAHRERYRERRKRAEAERRELGLCTRGGLHHSCGFGSPYIRYREGGPEYRNRNAKWFGCENPLSPRSRYFCEEHLKERTDQQRERRARIAGVKKP